MIELRETHPAPADHTASAEHRILLSSAYSRTGDSESAREALTEADLYATCACSPALNAEVAFYKALGAWNAGDYAAAERHAFEALDETAGPTHARLLEVLGMVARLRGNTAQSIAHLQNAIGHLERLQTRDIFHEANLLNNLSTPAAETNPDGIREFITARLETLPWTPDLQTLRFSVTHNVAWLDALAGNHLAAFRRFRSASELATGGALRILALTDRAFLAREMGESLNFAESVADAEDLAADVDWARCNVGQSEALLFLAKLVASTDPRRASTYIEQYADHRRKLDPTLTSAQSDPLLRGHEAHARGLIDAATGELVRAADYLREAHKLFVSVGSRWRAAVVALDLYEVSADEAALQFARDHAERVPHSWLARRIGRHSSTSRPAQHDVAAVFPHRVEARMNVA